MPLKVYVPDASAGICIVYEYTASVTPLSLAQNICPAVLKSPSFVALTTVQPDGTTSSMRRKSASVISTVRSTVIVAPASAPSGRSLVTVSCAAADDIEIIIAISTIPKVNIFFII